MILMAKDFIYLGSQSTSRRELLEIARIPYCLLSHTSSEIEDENLPEFSQRVLAVALGKMKTIKLPQEAEDLLQPVFVLTADTLIRTMHSKQTFGKPNSIDHARAMIATLRQEPVEIVTGCCLEKRIYGKGVWQILDFRLWATTAQAEFIISEDMVDLYFEKTPNFLHIASACAVEGFGQNFLKSLNGSYSGVLGLPLFELRQALKELKFRY